MAKNRNNEVPSNLGESVEPSFGGVSIPSQFSSHCPILQHGSSYQYSMMTCSDKVTKAGGKATVAQMISELASFFLSVPSFDLNEKKIKEMTRSTFIKMFECLVGQIFEEPYTLGPLEADVPKTLRVLGYPLLPKKSTLQTLGAPNSLPLIVQILYWLKCLLKFRDSSSEEFVKRISNLDTEAELFSRWLAGDNSVLGAPVDSMERTELEKRLKNADANIDMLKEKQEAILEQMRPLLDVENELHERLGEKERINKIIAECIKHQESCKNEIQQTTMKMRAMQDEFEAVRDQLVRAKVTRMQSIELNKQNAEKIQHAQQLSRKAALLKQQVSQEKSELRKKRIKNARLDYKFETLKKKLESKLEELTNLRPELATAVKSLQGDQLPDEQFINSLHSTLVELKVKSEEKLLEIKLHNANLKKENAAMEAEVAALKQKAEHLEKEMEQIVEKHEVHANQSRERINSLRCKVKELQEDPILQRKEEMENLESQLLAELDEAEINFCKVALEKNKERAMAVHHLKVTLDIFEVLYGIQTS